jgi:hypothetical protein
MIWTRILINLKMLTSITYFSNNDVEYCSIFSAKFFEKQRIKSRLCQRTEIAFLFDVIRRATS